MDPPAYDATVSVAASPGNQRTLQDLREQIIVNGQLMMSKRNPNPVEVLLAMIPSDTNDSDYIRHAGKHYALLTTPSHKTDPRIQIVYKGEPRATAEEALINLLEKLETMVHEVFVKNYSAPAEGMNTSVARWLSGRPPGRYRPQVI